MRRKETMKIKAIIEKNWSNEAISEVVNNPRCLEKYDDYSDRLELAALACMKKRMRNVGAYVLQGIESMAAEEIAGAIETYFYDCMVGNYIEAFIEELDAASAGN